MSHYVAETIWTREASERDFLANRYSRRHLLRFDGGVEIAGSSSPQNVRLPWSDEAAVDPEEAFVSALSSCHMLFFLSFAARDGFCVDRYVDLAEGVMEKDRGGKMSMTVVTLKPRVEFSGERLPTQADILRLHHESHEECFIANSVKSEVRCEPVWADAASAAAR
jgi:organic hydroperoxide reductase OsmC/OhrA